MIAALPGIALALVFGFFFIDKPNEFESAVKSTRAIVVVGAIGVGWVVLAKLVLPRILRPVWPQAVVLTGAAAAIALVVVVPYYRDTTVIETFPGGAPPTEEIAATTVAATSVEPSTTGLDPAGVTTVPAVAGPAQPLEPTATTSLALEPAPAATPAAATPPAATPAPATEPVEVSIGNFRGIDHRASGQAAIYRQPDGSYVVGLLDIDIESGPDYDVFLVPGADSESPVDGAIRIDDLKGNKGTQYYPAPAGTALSGEWSVLVWCNAFGVPIAAAPQSIA